MDINKINSYTNLTYANLNHSDENIIDANIFIYCDILKYLNDYNITESNHKFNTYTTTINDRNNQEVYKPELYKYITKNAIHLKMQQIRFFKSCNIGYTCIETSPDIIIKVLFYIILCFNLNYDKIKNKTTLNNNILYVYNIINTTEKYKTVFNNYFKYLETFYIEKEKINKKILKDNIKNNIIPNNIDIINNDKDLIKSDYYNKIYYDRLIKLYTEYIKNNIEEGIIIKINRLYKEIINLNNQTTQIEKNSLEFKDLFIQNYNNQTTFEENFFNFIIDKFNKEIGLNIFIKTDEKIELYNKIVEIYNEYFKNKNVGNVEDVKEVGKEILDNITDLGTDFIKLLNIKKPITNQNIVIYIIDSKEKYNIISQENLEILKEFIIRIYIEQKILNNIINELKEKDNIELYLYNSEKDNIMKHILTDYSNEITNFIFIGKIISDNELQQINQFITNLDKEQYPYKIILDSKIDNNSIQINKALSFNKYKMIEEFYNIVHDKVWEEYEQTISLNYIFCIKKKKEIDINKINEDINKIKEFIKPNNNNNLISTKLTEILNTLDYNEIFLSKYFDAYYK